ncbi:MAG: response regulator, partial [Bacteroidales bacterium]|nr:response regulator [Bacteroidales bacterium]
LTIRFANITDDPWRDQQFRYRLSRRETLLESVTRGHTVTLAGLQPGRYGFDVQVDGAEEDTARKHLDIHITPPLLSSWPARLLYVLLLLGLTSWLLYYYARHKKEEREQHLQRLEDQKQHEIYDAKINFFTNITHEIRTPLTLIKMPVDKMIGEASRYDSETQEDLQTVKSNTDRLLDLTNQLLDFRKAESKQLRLNFLKEDLCELTRRVCGYFTRAAKDNHIDLEVDIPENKIQVMCAATSIEKVISNLISNGLKYCKEKVRLSLAETPDGKSAILRVNSDGDAIPPLQREKIFEPFYQERTSQIKISGSKGTGLGLPFARMLTELHNGRLYLDESVPDGNSFVLELPKEQDQPEALTRPQATEQPDAEPADPEETLPTGRHTVLIAEDDVELNNYLRKSLSGEYNILQAFNGDEALALVKEQKVDILVSDIMMPGIDGCTLCNIVKTNLEYSHIPVLLLTAAVGMERHIETLQVGADGYLEKPFSIDLLRANIQNLFDNRELTFKQFTNSPLSHFNGLKVGNMDDDYMNRLHQEVMRRLSDPDLSIDELVSSLGTSKSTLFRKVKANTGLNIGEYIKLCRLKKAAELLAEQKYKIGEVVYRVGFTSASYFTANFKKQFNVSPSDFVRQVRGERKS